MTLGYIIAVKRRDGSLPQFEKSFGRDDFDNIISTLVFDSVEDADRYRRQEFREDELETWGVFEINIEVVKKVELN